MGKRFLLMMDHSSLTNFFSQPTLNARQAKWTTFLSEIYFEIKHLKGRENRVTNALSRKLHHVYEISFSRVEFNFSNQIREAIEKDLEHKYLF